MAQDLSGGILVVDFGSQTTLLIARRIRELGVYSEVWACNDPRLEQPPPCLGVILSGGPASVSVPASPRLANAVLELGRPVLGICYGMQLLVEHFGGRVEPGQAREYGHTEVLSGTALTPRADAPVRPDSRLLADFPHHGAVVWMSHADTVTQMPAGFVVTARSADNVVAAVEATQLPLFGVQFHPEVTHTRYGHALLERFTRDLCGAPGDWHAADLAQSLVEGIRGQVGPHDRVICGLSGGVDSTVTAALVAAAIHERLVCIMVDTGLMRAGEVEEVSSLFRQHFDAELRVVDARVRFLEALAGITDPEAKRKAIGAAFIDVFEHAASDVVGARWLAQGTLYPDVIESTSVRGPSSTIKSHHNVGGLPERLPFALLEPLRLFFKDEVRELGESLGIPSAFLRRHPFPGPGLAVRVLGEVTEERLAIVREADRWFIAALHEEGHYDAVWQAFAVLLPVKTVGVMGDARTYEHVVALRAVTSRDGMTAEHADLPLEFLARVGARIINRVHGVNRVVYDVTNKPPGTIEWE